jgi:hypothetical protein
MKYKHHLLTLIYIQEDMALEVNLVYNNNLQDIVLKHKHLNLLYILQYKHSLILLCNNIRVDIQHMNFVQQVNNILLDIVQNLLF